MAQIHPASVDAREPHPAMHTPRISDRQQAGKSLLDKVGISSLFDFAVDSSITFSSQRYVYTKDIRIGLIYRVLQAGVIVYVIYASMISYSYLHVGPAQGIVTGYVGKGTMYTGTNQMYTPTTCNSATHVCTQGSPVSMDVSDPPYCSAPYTDHYVENAEWDYGPIKCATFAQSSVGFKRTPGYLFVATLMHEREFTMRKCSDSDTACNTGTNLVTVVGDSCTCMTTTNYYAINPEGMQLVLTHDFSSFYLKGSSADGLNTGGTLTTYLRKQGSSENFLTWEQGSPISLSVGDLLSAAGIHLDEYLTTTTQGEALYGATGGNYPFNRNTGVCLLLDMKYLNFDESDGDNTGITALEHGDKVRCIIEVSRQGKWCSLGSENVDFSEAPSNTRS